MSRFAKALAAVSMTVATAGGGLLIAAAGAAPAYASAPAARPASHEITISAHPAAQAGYKMGPRVILPCAVKRGLRPDSSGCTGGNGPNTIDCTISSAAPFVTTNINEVDAFASVDCTSNVTAIRFSESLARNGTTMKSDGFTVQGNAGTADFIGATCQTGTWTNTATATITFPPGYVVIAGTNPIQQATSSLVDTCQPLVGGGGGGGGGCAVHAPSLARHPAGRHPDLVVCG